MTTARRVYGNVLAPLIYVADPGQSIWNATTDARQLGCQFLLFNDHLVPAGWNCKPARPDTDILPELSDYPNLGRDVSLILKFPNREPE